MARRPYRDVVTGVLFNSRTPRTIGAFVAIVLVAISARPVGGAHGAGPWVLGLLVLNSALLVLRLLPPRIAARLPETSLFVVAVVGVVVMMGFDRSGACATYGYFLAGQIGYRRDGPVAIAFAVAISTGCTGAVLIAHAATGLDTPWWVAALTGSTVILGISNRNREFALEAAHEAARQARAASSSEARAEALAERARIARDVHDVLAHSLAGINLQLEAVDALLDAGHTDRARTATHRAQSMVREGLAEVSRTVQAMRADALPLVASLTALVDSTAPDGTHAVVEGVEYELPTGASTALLRCAQEALTNARKYAPGAAVEVRLGFGTAGVELRVRNGAPPRGARPLASAGSGLGLIGMRERVLGVGGTLQTGPVVEGPAAGGWQVQVLVPR